MYKDTYCYVAVLTFAEDGISIEFPDLLGCLSCADSTEDAVKSAKEALSLHIYGMECDSEEIPKMTALENIHLEKNQLPVLIEVFMTAFREKMRSKFIKKTLSIPNWLNTMAERENINFSKSLQQSLMAQLHIDNQ